MKMKDYYALVTLNHKPSIHVENYLDMLSDEEKEELFKTAYSYVAMDPDMDFLDVLDGLCEIDMPNWEKIDA